MAVSITKCKAKTIYVRHGYRHKDGKFYVFGITKYYRILKECLRKYLTH